MDRFDWIEFDSFPSNTFKETAPTQDPKDHAPPNDAPSYYRAARRMREAGFFEQAAQLYAKSVGFNEHDYSARVEWMDTLLRAGQLDAAEKESAAALDNYRKVRLFYASRALVLVHRGACREALPLSDVSLEGRPSWYARCVRAELLLRQSLGNRAAALTHLEEAVDLAGWEWEPRFLGGAILAGAGWPVLAAAYFAEAVHVRPKAAAGLLGLGDCFYDLRLYDQAMFYYRKVTEAEPKHELALERQKRGTPLLYGLVRVFEERRLRDRWKRAYEPDQRPKEPWEYDL